MGTGPGLTLSAQLSEARYLLAATNLKCSDGNEYALVGGGEGGAEGGYVKTVDIYKNDESLTRTTDEFTGPGRSSLAATTIRCGNKEYVLFAGGRYIDDNGNVNVYSNDVDVFACNADGVYHEKLTQFTGPGRSSLAATTIRCGNDEYALFGGGSYNDNGIVFSNDVDVFACNADGVYHEKLTQFTGPGRESLAATTIRCGNDEYALFAGGTPSTGVSRSNDVDVFACNVDGVYHEKLTQFTGPGRSELAATTIRCGNDEYALLGGGFYLNDGFVYSNDVDVFECNGDDVYQKQLTQFTGPGRSLLAATTITIDGKQYALFMGGNGESHSSDAIDIYDCETGSFLPQPSS